jgi:hypothetical protein
MPVPGSLHSDRLPAIQVAVHGVVVRAVLRTVWLRARPCVPHELPVVIHGLQCRGHQNHAARKPVSAGSAEPVAAAAQNAGIACAAGPPEAPQHAERSAARAVRNAVRPGAVQPGEQSVEQQYAAARYAARLVRAQPCAARGPAQDAGLQPRVGRPDGLRLHTCPVVNKRDCNGGCSVILIAERRLRAAVRASVGRCP